MYSTVLTFIHQYKNYSQHLGQRSKVPGFKGEQRQNYSLEIIIPLLLSLLLTPQWWLRGCGRLFAKMTTNLSSLDMGPLAVWLCHSSHEEVGSNSPTLESGLALRLALINGTWWKESCVTSKRLSEKTLQLLPLQKLRPPCCEDSRDTRTWRESPSYCNHPSHLARSSNWLKPHEWARQEQQKDCPVNTSNNLLKFSAIMVWGWFVMLQQITDTGIKTILETTQDLPPFIQRLSMWEW